jgi:hypothetical protein
MHNVIALNRNPAIVFMAATFRGGGLPDAGFLGAIDTRSRCACPLQKLSRSARNRFVGRPAATIQLSQRDCLGHMFGLHAFGQCKVRDGASDAQDTVIGARREREALHGLLQQSDRWRLGVRADSKVRGLEARIRPALPPGLQLARRGHPTSHGLGRLGPLRGRNLLCRHARHLDVHVDSVQQRSGHATAVLLDAFRRAPAAGRRVSEVPARARVHGCHQLKARRELRVTRCARDHDVTRLEWLAQHFEYVTIELGQFVQEQDAIVRE